MNEVESSEMASQSCAMNLPHPSMSAMVQIAIKSLNNSTGSSLTAIKNFVVTEYLLDRKKYAPKVTKYIQKAAASGALVQTKGAGVKSFFKLAPEWNSTPQADREVNKTTKVKSNSETSKCRSTIVTKEVTKVKSKKNTTKDTTCKRPQNKNASSMATLSSTGETKRKNINMETDVKKEGISAIKSSKAEGQTGRPIALVRTPKARNFHTLAKRIRITTSLARKQSILYKRKQLPVKLKDLRAKAVDVRTTTPKSASNFKNVKVKSKTRAEETTEVKEVKTNSKNNKEAIGPRARTLDGSTGRVRNKKIDNTKSGEKQQVKPPD